MLVVSDLIQRRSRLLFVLISAIAAINLLCLLKWNAFSLMVDTFMKLTDDEPTFTAIAPFEPASTDYAEQFGELGRYLEALKPLATAGEATTLALDDILYKTFSFLKTPFSTLQTAVTPESRGIVVVTGIENFRFASHLIKIIRTLFECDLPIEVAYGGDEDLPPRLRSKLRKLVNDENISFLDLYSIFDESSLAFDKATGGWALKPFAMLATSFSEVILLDADTVFLQSPDVLFSQEPYQDNEASALLFHDRLLWKNAFSDRHEWWHDQMGDREPSVALQKSKVWQERYAEEADSGVVVMNKQDPQIGFSLLHICWQNSYPVREVTYQKFYGDKETWWFGLELTGGTYLFENHYGSMVGWKRDNKSVCSFTIAHLDDDEQLLWWNGGLLKNKAIDSQTFEAPTHYMVDAEWEKGARKADMSCTKNGEIRELSAAQIDIITRSIELAKEVDRAQADDVLALESVKSEIANAFGPTT